MPIHRRALPLPHNHSDRQNLNLNLPKTNTNPRKLCLFFLKCIIMSCILSLFLLFLGFAALVLLHFLFITTASRHRRRRSSDSTARIPNRVNLPEIIYDPTEFDVEARDCAICLEGFRGGEICRSLPSCGHLFHMGCVDNWIKKVPNCPVCRTRVGLGQQERSLIMSDDDWKIWWAVGR